MLFMGRFVVSAGWPGELGLHIRCKKLGLIYTRQFDNENQPISKKTNSKPVLTIAFGATFCIAVSLRVVSIKSIVLNPDLIHSQVRKSKHYPPRPFKSVMSGKTNAEYLVNLFVTKTSVLSTNSGGWANM